VDDFEAFRKKREAQKDALEEAEEANARAAANGQKLDWIDGMGPAGPRNPKVKGFVLGRFQRKRIDPKNLKRPDGYEARAQTVQPAVDDEVAKRRAQLERAEAELRAAEEKRRLAAIEKRRKAEGFSKIKGMQRF